MSHSILTLSLFSSAIHLCPSSLLGIDLDPQLISDAQKYHSNRLEQLRKQLSTHTETETETVEKLRMRIRAVENVLFRVEDFLSDGSEIHKRKEKFDVILW